MYKELTKNDFLRGLKLPSTYTLDGVLTYGGWHIKSDVEIARSLFEKFEELDERMYAGIINNKRVLFAISYGGSIASEFVHIGAILGAKITIHTGSFGALKKGMKHNDLLIPDSCFPGDGSSNWYMRDEGSISPSLEVNDWIERKLKGNGVNSYGGKLFTTSAMLGETWRDVMRWNKEGYSGVDLETATVFAVAKHFKIKSGAILHLSDNLIEKQTMFDLTDEQRMNRQEVKKLVMEIGLEAIVNFS